MSMRVKEDDKLKIKVCHITSAHPRYDQRILLKECVSLAKTGYDTYLVVNDGKTDEEFEGVKIRSTQFKANTRFKRFVLSHSRLYNIARELDADIYHFHDPDLLPMMSKLRRKGKKVIFDSHENIPKQILSKGWLPSPLRKIVAWLYEKYEKRVISHASCAITVTPAIVDRYIEFQEKTYLVTNYPLLREKVVKDRTKLKTIGFAGGVGELYNHLTILDAIKSIDDIVYYLAGKMSSEYYAQLNRHPSWPKVKYLGLLTHFDVYGLIYNNTAIGMCLHSAIQTEGIGSFGVVKLFEMMEQGIPVICTDYPIWEEINDKYEFGICVDPKDTEAIREAIVFLLDNPDQARQLGENGRRAVEVEYNWETQERVLLEAYKSLSI